MQEQEKKQIPRGNDRKKNKGKGKCQYRGLSTALRFGRDDERFARHGVYCSSRDDMLRRVELEGGQLCLDGG